MRSARRIAFALVLGTAVSAALLILRPAAAAPGDLDPTFGSGGSVDTQIGSGALAGSVAVQPDGRILAGGTSSVNVSSFTLARYQPDGQLDVSFGSGGVVTGLCCGASAMVLQPDGKILLAGRGSQANRAVFRVVRYRPDGGLDGTFGSAGIATGPEGGAEGLALQPDGKIVVGGTATEAYAFELARFNADGTLDQGFGAGGSVQTLLGSTASASAIAVLADGRILAGGGSVPGPPPPPPPPPPAPPPPPPPGPPPTPWQMTLALYKADGTLDSSFGSTGFVRTQLGYSAIINALRIQPDGKIVVAGHGGGGLWGPRNLVLARYLQDGALDPAFGSGGIVMSRMNPEGWAYDLVLQPDGRIVVAGTYGVARYRADGTPDTTFGVNGVSSTGSLPLTAFAVALQRDGRIVAAGDRANRDGFALNRYFARSPTTIAGAPTLVRYGRTSVISGTVAEGAAGVRVQILRAGCHEFGKRAVATATTGPGGRWRVRVRAGSRTSYQAKLEAETSSLVFVHVRPKVTLSKVARGQLRARVLAASSLGGQTVVLQRFSRNRWVDGRRVVLRRIAKRRSGIVSGRMFSAPKTAGRRLRLFFPEARCYAAAASAPITG